MEPLKLPQLGRDSCAEIRFARKEGEPTRISFSASSEAPVERYFGNEVLSHDAGSIRMDRVNRGAMPLLFNHNWDDPIGMIEGARVEDSRLVVDAKLFDTARAKEVAAMVDGGLRNVSIGYRLHTIEENKDTNTFTARDWEPYEVSVVTIPADPTVGIGRQLGGEELEVRMVRSSPSAVEGPAVSQPAVAAVTTKGHHMTTQENAAAGAVAENNLSAVQMEQQRRKAIQELVKANKLDSRIEAKWITEGTALSDVASEILNVMEERGKTNPATAAALGLSNRETNRYSLFKAIRALHYGGRNPEFVREAAFEMECSRAVSKQLKFCCVRSARKPRRVRCRSRSRHQGRLHMVGIEQMGFIDILRNRSVAMRWAPACCRACRATSMFPRQSGKPR
jgi:HK97 family phage prohead protease